MTLRDGLTNRPAGLVGAGSPQRERRIDVDRRHTTIRTFVQSGFTPRRRGARRSDERHMPVDWHEPYLLGLAVTILLLNVVDAFLTLTLLTTGAREANPFVAFILDAHPRLFALTKMGLTGVRRADSRRGRADSIVQRDARRQSAARGARGVRGLDRIRVVVAARRSVNSRV